MDILHISDLHLNYPHDNTDALRKGFYIEYLDSLISMINEKEITIDLIFITGDIVNEARFDNYKLAAEIILHLSFELNVEKEKIYISIGNHDICNKTGSKNAFDKFIQQFNDGHSLAAKGERYRLYSESNYAILCLDSIGCSHETGNPSSLSIQDKDEIINVVKKEEPNNLFVLSHHPPFGYEMENQAIFDEHKSEIESTDYTKKHTWSDGGNLFKRLSSKTVIKNNLYWFAGDTHRPEIVIIDTNRIKISTGKINTNENDKSNILPQARTIHTNDLSRSIFYEYRCYGHYRRGLDGNWEPGISPISTYNTHTHIDKVNQYKFDIAKVQKEVDLNQDHHYLQKKVYLIDTNLENELYNEIVSNELYEFGRFDTNTITSSLSWISIHGLFKSYPFFSKVVNAFKKQIQSIIPSGINEKDCLLIGIDLWGSILATRLGAAANIRSCCVAVRSLGDSYDSYERVNDRLKGIVRKKKYAFVVSDVISTGYSIAVVQSELACPECANWYNLTIFCDPHQEHGNFFDAYESTFFLCGLIRMPIIERSKLPEDVILKANISFIRD